MNAILALLIAVFKAVPALAKLTYVLSDALREHEAQKRLEGKDADVDAAIDRVRLAKTGKQQKANGKT